MSIVFKPYCGQMQKLAAAFTVNPDSCKNPAYFEQYIRDVAEYDRENGNGVTHVIITEDERALCGFITLRAASLLTVDDGIVIGEPAIEISNLAVAQSFERRGIGTALLSNALVIALDLSDQIGIRYILLRADPQSLGFYKKFGFHESHPFYYDTPKVSGNAECIPMMMQLP